MLEGKSIVWFFRLILGIEEEEEIVGVSHLLIQNSKTVR